MGKKKMGENKNCQACKNEFYVPAYRKSTAKFCSPECQNHKQYEKFNFLCWLCKKECQSSPSRQGRRKFCSVECANDYQIDRKKCNREKRREHMATAREKGIVGKTGGAVRKYAFSVMALACKVCGYKEYLSCLDVHHINGNPNDNQKENLAILCVMCHRKVHRKIIAL